MLIDNADQNRFWGACVCTDGIQLCAAVMEFMDDLVDQFFFVSSDDCKFVCCFCALEHQITHKGGQETVNDTQRRRFIVHIPLGVYEDRGHCDDSV